jgi:hypothetical protein
MNATSIEHDEEKSQPRRKGKTGHSFQVLEKARALLLQFQVLVARTYYLPSAMLDGADEVHAFDREWGRARLNELYVLICKYLKSLDGLCRLSEDMRKHLDKPNAHRLLELYAHTLPAFGRVHHIQELVFESEHQPLKRGIRSSNHRNEQVFSISAALASDWESRLAFEVEKLLKRAVYGMQTNVFALNVYCLENQVFTNPHFRTEHQRRIFSSSLYCPSSPRYADVTVVLKRSHAVGV